MGKYRSIGKKVRTSNELYQECLEKTTAKGRRSLINLKKMCDDLEKRGLEIAVSVLSRESDRLGISPKMAALRNNPKLVEYVKKRYEEQKLVEKDISGNGDFEELAKMLRRENCALRAFIRKMNIK
jgi:hypothetical protein